jgi:iron complex outermembrane recepter protein
MAQQINGGLKTALLVSGLACASPSLAQVARDDVLAESDDAFGTQVGLESTGIYTESETRGFNPLDAGNVRINGAFFDQAAFLTNRLKANTAIRVGFSAVETPFVAPTGVVEHNLKPFPKETGASFAYTRHFYGGTFAETEVRLPIKQDRIALMGGIAGAKMIQADGARSHSWGISLRSIIRIGRFEFAPFYGGGRFERNDAKPLVVVTDGFVPKQPKPVRYLGQDWVRGDKDHGNFGANLKGSISDHLYFRGGLFHSLGDKQSGFSEIYRIRDSQQNAQHFVLADPAQDVRSTSGEGVFVLHYRGDRMAHRFYAGYRGRDRLTETDGSDFIDLGTATYGQFDRIAKPAFEFTRVNRGTVRQSALLLGYVGLLKDVGSINLGVQKARYRAALVNGETGLTDRVRADPWIYNLALRLNLAKGLTAYAATQTGLEDSGLAPENAANRNEQLPAAKSRQYEAGLRWDLSKAQLVLATFEIAKPYFSYGPDLRFVILGDQRHRGLEFSATAHFDKRFDVLFGAYVMDPSVSGPGRASGLFGSRPTGVPDVYARLDASWHTGLPGALTLTASVEHLGKRAATAAGFARLGGKQVMLPAVTTLDLGTRHYVRFGKTDIGVRVIARNLFDAKAWHVSAADVLLPKQRRSAMVVASVDF